jgi:hypothetical protein
MAFTRAKDSFTAVRCHTRSLSQISQPQTSRHGGIFYFIHALRRAQLPNFLESLMHLEQQTENLRPLIPSREQVLARLWEIANMSSEITRGSLTGQVKALQMIVAIEGLIPDRRARSVDNKPAPAARPQPNPAFAPSETQSVPYARDTRVPFSLKKNRRRR